MPPITKNLGLIRAIHEGVNPPLNVKMLWYNTNPTVNKHFYFDVVDLIWKPLYGGGGISSSITINNEAPDSNGNFSLDINLPTPIIAKRKVDLGEVEDNNGPTGIYKRQVIDSISPRNILFQDLQNIEYPEAYYVDKLDIYFDSFGNRDWLSLPDLKLEMLMVSNKNYKSESRYNFGNLNISSNGNKDYFTTALVHPANNSIDNPNISNTIFSGGNGGNPNENYTGNPIDLYVSPTEWSLKPGDQTFGQNTINSRNKLNNPNITVDIDVRKFFRFKNRQPIQYPVNLEDSVIKVKNIGYIKKNNATGKVYRRNTVLFFRLSAGVPDSIKNGFSAKYAVDLITPNNGDTIIYDLGNGHTGSLVYDNNFVLSVQITNSIKSNYGTLYQIMYDNANSVVLKKRDYTTDITPVFEVNNSSIVDTVTIVTPSNSDSFYTKRIFSNISLPVYICPRIGQFNDGSNIRSVIFGHRLSIGQKS